MRETVAKKFARLPVKRKRLKYQPPIYCERDRHLLEVLNVCREERLVLFIYHLQESLGN